MPIYRLSKELVFPNPSFADEDGLLAIEGDLSTDRLLLAYCNGIFPWFSDDEPILWWSPPQRFVLYPKDIRTSHSMKKLLKNNIYSISFNTCFRNVISNCSSVRKETGTWITKEMIDAYCKLHELGFAHSVETWYGDKLVGGLYGVSIGKCFFGESMFSIMGNASKVAIITLSKILQEKDFVMIDCQVYTEHLESLGAVNLPRKIFLELLEKGVIMHPLKLSL